VCAAIDGAKRTLVSVHAGAGAGPEASADCFTAFNKIDAIVEY